MVRFSSFSTSIPGPVSRKPGTLFGPGIKPIRSCVYSPSVSQKGEVYTAETSCMKGTSVLNKHLCNHKIRNFDAAFRV